MLKHQKDLGQLHYVFCTPNVKHILKSKNHYTVYPETMILLVRFNVV